MKWAYSVQQKTKVVFWSTIILVLVFAKNWIDNNNVATLDHSFTTVYDDRLVVESYIFLLSDHLYQKKISISSCSGSNVSQKIVTEINYHNEAIAALIKDFEGTKLTTTESFYFKHLKEILQQIRSLETSLITADSQLSNANNSDELQRRFEIAMMDLNQLSKIQLAEGKVLKDKSKQIAAGSTLLTQFELTIIVGIALLIQILIFSSKSTIPLAPQQFKLN
jgi:hypothetical protein